MNLGTDSIKHGLRQFGIGKLRENNKNVILIDDRYTEQIKPALRLGIEAYTPQYIMLNICKYEMKNCKFNSKGG